MLGDDLASELSALQAEAESMMRDTCTVRRKTGTTFDRVTGKTADVLTTIYAGRCRLRTPDVRTVEPDVGGVVWTVQDTTLSLPVATGSDVRVDDVATIDASTLAPWLVGRRFVISSDPATTFATAARYRCREVVR